MNHIAIDLGSKESQICVRGPDGAILEERKHPTRKLVELVADWQPSRVVMETWRAMDPEAEFFFITGADALASILSWQDWRELFGLAKFVGVSRPGYDLGVEHLSGHLDNYPADVVTLIEIPALAISSTDCRTRAAQDRPISYLVPDGVVQYISKRQLYRQPDATVFSIDVAVAKSRACASANLAVQEAVQMHGGIGMTDAVDIGLFMKRARVCQELFGDARFHANRIAKIRGY